MDKPKEIQQLKEKIASPDYSGNKQELVEKLVEFQDVMDSMEFFTSLHRSSGYIKDKQTTDEKKLADIAAYGIKYVRGYRAIASGKDFKFCPYCQSELSTYNILDPYLYGLKCANNHYFHITLKDGIWEGVEAFKTLRVDSENPIEIAKDWLTNTNFRKYLHPQAAAVLRKYIDLSNSVKSQNKIDLPHLYCPLCGTGLNKIPLPKGGDSWCQYLLCNNNHMLSSRNGLTYKMALLAHDISDDYIYHLINFFFESQTEKLNPQPNQILELFTKIIKEKEGE